MDSQEIMTETVTVTEKDGEKGRGRTDDSFLVSGRRRSDVNASGKKRILIATVPADGHFNPLTGLAKQLAREGYEVAWYAHEVYRDKIRSLGLHHFPFIRPPKFNQYNFESYYPERKNIKGAIAKFRFDFTQAYLNIAPAYYSDICEIYEDFPFDLMIADIMFSGIPYVKDKMNLPVVAIGVMPVMESSPGLAPAGTGLRPAKNWLERLRNKILSLVADKIIFPRLNQLCNQCFEKDGVRTRHGNFVDLLYRKPDLVLQSGTPSFEYERKLKNPNLHFVGPLYPVMKTGEEQDQIREMKSRYEKLILVTQGTIEKDPEKIIVPVLEAYKNSRFLIVATTGGSGTEELRKRFPEQNIYITDFLPFAQVMPITDLYISNGGYGGVLMSIRYRVPMIVAGVHEGKNEICTRVGYFGAGVDLRTERPRVRQIRAAVEKIFSEESFSNRLEELSADFNSYSSYEVCTAFIRRLIGHTFKLPDIYRRSEDYHVKSA